MKYTNILIALISTITMLLAGCSGLETIPTATRANVAATALTGTSSVIRWSTDQASNSTVEYGLSNLTYDFIKQSTDLVTSHAIVLNSLQAGTRYFYRLKSITPTGEVVISRESSFTTPINEGVGLRLSWQNDPKTTMSIIWHSPKLNPTSHRGYVGNVQYGLTTAYELGQVTGTDKLTSDLGAWHHKVELTGLQPDTEYHYRVGDPGKGGWWSLDHTFRTAPAAGPSPFSFSIFADQSINPAAWDVMGALLGQNTDFHIIAGDISYTKKSNWRKWLVWENMVEPHSSRTPYMLSRGDNDSEFFYDRLFLLPNDETADQRWYSFDYANTHFIALDIAGSDCGNARDPVEQAWLESDLISANANPDTDWIMAYSSCPPFSVNSYHGSDKRLRETYGRLFDQYGVDIVFGADDHNYQRSFPVLWDETVIDFHPNNYLNTSGTIYMVIGTGGMTLNNKGFLNQYRWNAHRELSHGFTQVAVDGNSIQVKFVNSLGQVLDEFNLQKSD